MDENVSDSIRAEFGVRLSRVGHAWRQRIDAEFKQHGGLTASKWRPLYMLGRLGDGVWQKDLAAALSIEGPSLVRLLDELESQRLIERRPDPVDRRAKTIHLTAEGWDAYRGLKEVTGEFAAKFLSGITETEFQVCIDVLDRIEARLNGDAETEAAQ